MRVTELIHPEYSKRFRCIGSACEDTCCQGWSIPIDQATYEKYKNLPASELSRLVDESLLVEPEGRSTKTFAKIKMTAANQCPLLSEEHLCRVQGQYGEDLLSHVCAVYPRIAVDVAGAREVALSLSCPEAARLVLLSPVLLDPLLVYPVLDESDRRGPEKPLLLQADPVAQSRLGEGAAAGANAAEECSPLLQGSIWEIRRIVLATVKNRAYPLWQRLFLLGVLCQRLDAIASGKLERSVEGFLRDFEVTVATRALRPSMESLPVDGSAQLDVVLRLAGMMLHRSNVLPRFAECIQKFTTGIGNGPGATLESLTREYTQAHDRWYAPFFDRHPYILENLLVNTMFRCRFPLGSSAGTSPAEAPSLSREAALLTAQFALMRGLLIGVAGYHRESFSSEHVIHAVQSASKHFEHHPEFLNHAYALLKESRMDTSRGLAVLLREAQASVQRKKAPGQAAEFPVQAIPSPEKIAASLGDLAQG